MSQIVSAVLPSSFHNARKILHADENTSAVISEELSE